MFNGNLWLVPSDCAQTKLQPTKDILISKQLTCLHLNVNYQFMSPQISEATIRPAADIQFCSSGQYPSIDKSSLITCQNINFTEGCRLHNTFKKCNNQLLCGRASPIWVKKILEFISNNKLVSIASKLRWSYWNLSSVFWRILLM